MIRHISLRELEVRRCEVTDIQPVIEEVHYSHSIFGVTTDYCFSVVLATGEIVGGAIFGKPAGVGVLEKYSDNLVVPATELRRFVLIDELPRNSESFVLGKMFRILKRECGIKRVLSYADPAFGHSGVIYKALGFEYRGRTNKRKHIIWNGKKYPDRNIHQVHFPFHLELRAALANGSASRVDVEGKHIYLKEL